MSLHDVNLHSNALMVEHGFLGNILIEYTAVKQWSNTTVSENIA